MHYEQWLCHPNYDCYGMWNQDPYHPRQQLHHSNQHTTFCRLDHQFKYLDQWHQFNYYAYPFFYTDHSRPATRTYKRWFRKKWHKVVKETQPAAKATKFKWVIKTASQQVEKHQEENKLTENLSNS